MLSIAWWCLQADAYGSFTNSGVKGSGDRAGSLVSSKEAVDKEMTGSRFVVCCSTCTDRGASFLPSTQPSLVSTNDNVMLGPVMFLTLDR